MSRRTDVRNSGFALAFASASPLDHSAMVMKRNSASSTDDFYIRARMNPGWPAMIRALSFHCPKNRSDS
jgi:hypothetical protein